MRPAEYVGVDVVTQVGDQFDVGHANAVLGVSSRARPVTRRSKPSSAATSARSWPTGRSSCRTSRKFNESLAFLKDRTAGELGQAFRTTLDLYSHRLDAWITSLATKRLDEMRETSAAGRAYRRLRRGRRSAARLGRGRPIRPPTASATCTRRRCSRR